MTNEKSTSGPSPKLTCNKLYELITSLQSDVTALKADKNNLKKELCDVKSELAVEIDYLRVVVTRQNTNISLLEREIDDQNQYNRRENVVFSNVNLGSETDCRKVVADLCNEIGADVEPDDLVDAHPLPNRRGRSFKVIARFRNRSKARDVFVKRRECKNITQGVKDKLCVKKNRGIGIHPNLTAKKGKLLYQTKVFSEGFGYQGAWADYNTGKIYLKLKSNEKGVVIKDTSDLIEINSRFNPAVTDYVYCTPPLFIYEDDKPQKSEVDKSEHE